MNILSLQHHDDEHAGYLRHLLVAKNHTLTTVMMHRGESIPSVERFDALWVLGGPMDVWQTDENPWLVPEIAAIRQAVQDLGKPYFGLCLGHQLLAAALGGEVAAGTPEIGVLPVHLNDAGRASRFLAGAPSTFPTLQWHSAEVVAEPPGSTVLATSPACAVQAMSVGEHALSFQFHLEAVHDTVATWGAVPEYRAALLNALGQDGPRALAQACDAALADMNSLCERLYTNWVSAVEEQTGVSA